MTTPDAVPTADAAEHRRSAFGDEPRSDAVVVPLDEDEGRD
jgi:hypothetical protein